MRKIKYLSPTALKQFESEPAEFYMTRLAEVKPPKIQQTRPMGVGSAFDAFVKSYLYDVFHGNAKGTEYELKTLFNTQVENDREWLWEAGKYAFEQYRDCGALADIVGVLRLGYNIKFESTVERVVSGVPLLGKPDLSMTLNNSVFILDWKVNGFCGKYNTSPAKYYVNVYGGRGHGTPHKKVLPRERDGVMICEYGLDEVNKDWASQTTTYTWCLGVPVGTPTICGIDQLACNGKKLTGEFPEIRVAQIRCLIDSEFQEQLIARYQKCWETAGSRDLMKEYLNSFDIDIDVLDEEADALGSLDKDDPVDALILNVTGR